jgi:sarcosine oxidase subunit beta
MGASIAYHLAARGCADVCILEQADTEITGSTARSATWICRPKYWKWIHPIF